MISPSTEKQGQKNEGTAYQYHPHQLLRPSITLPHNWPLWWAITWIATSTWKRQHGKRSALLDGSISSRLYSLEALLIRMCSTVTFNLAFSVFKTSKISILRAQWYYNATVSTLLFNTSFCNLLKHFLFFCCKLSLYYSLWQCLQPPLMPGDLLYYTLFASNNNNNKGVSTTKSLGWDFKNKGKNKMHHWPRSATTEK